MRGFGPPTKMNPAFAELFARMQAVHSNTVHSNIVHSNNINNHSANQISDQLTNFHANHTAEV